MSFITNNRGDQLNLVLHLDEKHWYLCVINSIVFEKSVQLKLRYLKHYFKRKKNVILRKKLTNHSSRNSRKHRLPVFNGSIGIFSEALMRIEQTFYGININ